MSNQLKFFNVHRFLAEYYAACALLEGDSYVLPEIVGSERCKKKILRWFKEDKKTLKGASREELEKIKKNHANYLKAVAGDYERVKGTAQDLTK